MHITVAYRYDESKLRIQKHMPMCHVGVCVKEASVMYLQCMLRLFVLFLISRACAWSILYFGCLEESQLNHRQESMCPMNRT